MSASFVQTDRMMQATMDSRQVSIHDPQSAWIVERGFVDLFYDSLISDGSLGPRRHILRATRGHAIFGFPPDIQETTNRRFFLVRSLDAELCHVDIRKLQQLGPNGEPDVSGTELLNRWIENISFAVAPEVTPRDSTGLEAGGTVCVPKGKNVSCLRDVVWIRHRKGSSQFLGLSAAVISSDDHFFPLICRTWVNICEDSMLEGFGT